MSDSSGIIPSFRLRAGTVIGNFILTHRLGCGYEGEVFAAREIGTNLQRAIKIFPINTPEDLERVIQFGWLFEKIAESGSVARYFGWGQTCLPSNGELVAYLCLELLEGTVLGKYLRSLRGRANVREQECLRLLTEITKAIGRVHQLGYAVGDFDHGENILILEKSRLPMIFDLEPGEQKCPNRDFENDVEELDALIGFIFSLPLQKQVFRAIKALLNQAQKKPIRKDTMKRLAIKFECILKEQE